MVCPVMVEQLGHASILLQHVQKLFLQAYQRSEPRAEQACAQQGSPGRKGEHELRALGRLYGLRDAMQLMPGEPMHRDRAVPLRSSPSSRHLGLGLDSQPQPAPSICREQACSPACVERLRCVVAPVEIAVRQIAPTDAARSAYSEYSQVGAAVPRTRSTHRWAWRFAYSRVWNDGVVKHSPVELDGIGHTHRVLVGDVRRT